MISEKKKSHLLGKRKEEPEESLSQIIDPVQEINRLQNNIRNRVGLVIKDIIQIGETLINLKKTLKHGQFTEWLKSNKEVLGFEERTAQRYMSVYNNRFKLESKLNEINDLSSAYKLISSHEIEKPNSSKSNDVRDPRDIYRDHRTGIRLKPREREILKDWLVNEANSLKNKAKNLLKEVENL
ncbi:DUF3102 domain-containing protein [Leptospira levettii]|uniref:DUF3102 domain-containing protein n=1 Tax=Leptospira levettii TaxID=2023178 RepID=UPI001083CC0F|nr:DUF3102 domain-containing protein [Leptospira levettii]TGM95028.1 DUF3102 domain-containing protein [Leptospira levettii]